MATLYKIGSEPRELKPANGTDFTFKELYPILECDTIEIINLRNGTMLLCDEMPPDFTDVNMPASLLYRKVGGSFIVGHALLCKDSEVK